MHRFYCPDLSELRLNQPPQVAAAAAEPKLVHLDPEETRHARRVLRMELGDPLVVFDGRGGWARGVLKAWNDGDGLEHGRGGRGVVEVRKIHVEAPPQPALDLAVAIPKGGHADDMIASLSQLGVNQLIPLRAQRAVVEPRAAKIDRFNRAAVESAKQCGRPYLMKVAPPAGLEEVLARDHDLRLIAAPAQGDCPDKSRITEVEQRLRSAARVLILIGPEGGWAPQELAAASTAGCMTWSLGPHIMRIETAAAAAAAIARYAAR